MKNNFFIILLILIPIVHFNSATAGRCSGGAYCTACSNCSSCKNCSEEGGTCSVCSNYDEPESETEYIPTPVVESEPKKTEYYESHSDYEAPKEEKSNYTWIWWIGGILGGLWLLGSLGKK